MRTFRSTFQVNRLGAKLMVKKSKQSDANEKCMIIIRLLATSEVFHLLPERRARWIKKFPIIHYNFSPTRSTRRCSIRPTWSIFLKYRRDKKAEREAKGLEHGKLRDGNELWLKISLHKKEYFWLASRLYAPSAGPNDEIYREFSWRYNLIILRQNYWINSHSFAIN